MPFRTDERIAHEKCRQQRQAIGNAKRRRQAELEHAGGFAASAGRSGNGVLQRFEIAANVVQETLAGFGQGQFACRALEQTLAEIALQHGNVAADGGWRQPEQARGGGKAARLGAANEGFEIGERLHRSSAPDDLQRILENKTSKYRLILDE